nr:helix-turn-helix domain-containing protein [Herbaspirillum sp. ASV7]
MSIHSRIKQRREALGLSMQNLADMVGVSAWQTVQQWEREDGTAPKRERLSAVAQALKTTPEYLLLGSPDSTESSLALGKSASGCGISENALKVARSFDALDAEAQQALMNLLGILEKKG